MNKEKIGYYLERESNTICVDQGFNFKCCLFLSVKKQNSIIKFKSSLCRQVRGGGEHSWSLGRGPVFKFINGRWQSCYHAHRHARITRVSFYRHLCKRPPTSFLPSQPHICIVSWWYLSKTKNAEIKNFDWVNKKVKIKRFICSLMRNQILSWSILYFRYGLLTSIFARSLNFIYGIFKSNLVGDDRVINKW